MHMVSCIKNYSFVVDINLVKNVKGVSNMMVSRPSTHNDIPGSLLPETRRKRKRTANKDEQEIAWFA